MNILKLKNVTFAAGRISLEVEQRCRRCHRWRLLMCFDINPRTARQYTTCRECRGKEKS